MMDSVDALFSSGRGGGSRGVSSVGCSLIFSTAVSGEGVCRESLFVVLRGKDPYQRNKRILSPAAVRKIILVFAAAFGIVK